MTPGEDGWEKAGERSPESAEEREKRFKATKEKGGARDAGAEDRERKFNKEVKWSAKWGRNC